MSWNKPHFEQVAAMTFIVGMSGVLIALLIGFLIINPVATVIFIGTAVTVVLIAFTVAGFMNGRDQ